MLRVAVVQHASTHDREDNVARGVEALGRAARAGARLVCFAELAFDRFHPQRPAEGDPSRLAERVPGPTADRFAEAARDHGVVVVLNLYERADAGCFDSSPVIDADGTLLGRTRMVHITDYEGFHEQGYYAPGDLGLPVFDTAVGRLGVAICYDRHYPEVMRTLALRGADIVVVPQAGSVGEWPDGLFEAEMRVAAFQNGYFTILANRVGPEEVLEFAGGSFVCDPAGRVVARAPEGEEHLLLADLDVDALERCHARRLFLRDRRPELYAAWLAR